MARYLITSALPYINGIKHLGNLAGSMLPADVHARFRRLCGDEVLFLCATDEHGTPAELAAAEAGLDVATYCAQQHEIQKSACAGFLLSFDHFGRSSNAPNHALTRHFCDRLIAAGLVEERVTQQIFSPTDRRFLPDRYVEGTCPHCGFERARGDQCDNCGRLLDPTDLRAPRSKISGATDLEIRDTAHLWLRQPMMAARIRAWVEGASDWPHLARSIAFKWLDEGLQDRAITRDLSWGIPVLDGDNPRFGFENKVFYVWFDAPVEYIACAQEWAAAKGLADDAWKRWWRTDQGADDVTYVQFMGKDNVAFHTVSFPVTIMGSGEPWKLVDRLKAFNWVTWYGGKFSTSEKRGIFMDQALELLPADYWRWYLMANAPESADAPFTLEHFQQSVNSDLANVFGNLINRITRFCAARFESRVPESGMDGPLEKKLWSDAASRLAVLTECHETMEFRKAAAETRALWALGNEYLQQAAPWTAIRTDPDRAAVGVRTGLSFCAFLAALSQPFVPNGAGKVLDALGVSDGKRRWPGTDIPDRNFLAPGAGIATLDVLFRKVEDEEVLAWSQRFGAGD